MEEELWEDVRVRVPLCECVGDGVKLCDTLWLTLHDGEIDRDTINVTLTLGLVDRERLSELEVVGDRLSEIE